MQTPRKWIRPALPATCSAREAFAAIVRASLDQIAANVPGAAAGRDPECLHQLRIGVRRLRSAAGAFRGLLRRRRADDVEQSWRAMMQTLGAARDWDVFQRAVEPGALQPEAGRRRAEAQRLARALVRSPQFRDAQLKTLAWARNRPWRRRADRGEPLRQFAGPALQRLHRHLRRAAQGMDWSKPASRHRLRIRVKRMRYGCDCFATAFPHRRVRAFLEALHNLQDNLGEMNDIDVQRRLLRRMVPRGSPLKIVEAEAAARARLASREREQIAALDPAWAAFEARRPFWLPGEGARVQRRKRP